MIRRHGRPTGFPTVSSRTAVTGVAGASAWERVNELVRSADREHAAARRRLLLRLITGVLVLALVGWSTVAVGWELTGLRSSVGGDMVLVGFVLGSGICGRQVIATASRLRAAGTARRRYAALTATSLPAAAADPRLGLATLDGAAAYWFGRAIAGHRTATVLEQLPGLTWWHDVAVAADPAAVFDHLGVGTAGIVTVQHIVMPWPAALTVDPDVGLSCAGVPITGFGAAGLMARQLRAGSSAARAAGLPLACVTSIAVVSNAHLVDTWGAPTGVERMQHRQALIKLSYCIPEQLPAALLLDTQLDPDTAVLAAHQLAEHVRSAAEVFHTSLLAPAGTDPVGRRYELPHQEVHP